jgi:aarF domain-containing kinase
VSARLHSWAETEQALEYALGPDLKNEITIDPKHSLVGSGSAAQVYLATYNKQRIAIKVLHPGIMATMNADLDILSLVTSLAEMVPGVAEMSLYEGMEEFRSLLLQQLDLVTEAEALIRFRKNFRGSQWESIVRFPEPLMELTSSDVLFETYEDGQSISKFLERDKPTKSKLANICLEVLLKMVFEDNFVHGDLHGGNILVRESPAPTHAQGSPHASKPAPGHGYGYGGGEDSSTSSICSTISTATSTTTNDLILSVIDTGIAHTMTPHDRRNFIDVFYAFIRKDGTRVGQIMSKRSR